MIAQLFGGFGGRSQSYVVRVELHLHHEIDPAKFCIVNVALVSCDVMDSQNSCAVLQLIIARPKLVKKRYGRKHL